MNRSFIEVQFPISKLSKESYKERKAGDSQTLTPLGKWHGRKPLVLVRAVILGLLLPESDDPKRDREIFLKLMTMDDEGMWRRCKGLSAKDAAPYLTPDERNEALVESGGRISWARDLSEDRKEGFQKRAFLRMSYDDRLKHCVRPEEIDGPDESAWREINAYLGTNASNLPELVRELGQRRFGRVPTVGDAFAGSGAVPFEAARIGCDVVASDLNPVAVLLTYGALALVGGSPEILSRAKEAQREVFEAVRRQVEEWGIERNELGWEADVYLYCNEVLDPLTGWRVPLLTTFAIDPGERVVLAMEPDRATKSIRLTVREGVTEEELGAARAEKTYDGGVASPFDAEGNYVRLALRQWVSVRQLRGPHGLRRWEKGDWKPRRDDVYQERLYCIRWNLPDLRRLLCLEQLLRGEGEAEGWSPTSIDAAIRSVTDRMSETDRERIERARQASWAETARCLLSMIERAEEEKEIKRAVRALPAWLREGLEACRRQPERVYAAPTEADLEREARVEALLAERFESWQREGFLPNLPIESGSEINRLVIGRGWTWWHHLYNPRQLLLNGLFAAEASRREDDPDIRAALLLSQMKLADWGGRLCRWHTSAAKCEQILYSPGIPTIVNYACRGLRQYEDLWNIAMDPAPLAGEWSIRHDDAARLDAHADLWITDPGYGDMIAYAQVSELFLAWVRERLGELPFIAYTDSKRALAVEEAGDSFASALHRCYANLARHMPDDGLQVVMFTSQDAQTWADLCLLLGAAGLQVVQAWTIATEAPGQVRQGTFVQGTVFLVLRKRKYGAHADLVDIHPEVRMEVRRQLETMRQLDDKESPSFGDSAYQLAAYAAAVRVITSYDKIAEIDVARELARGGRPDPNGVIRSVIDSALREAVDFLVPKGLEPRTWRACSPEERFYLKGIEIEAHGEKRVGVYQEFARGFGVQEFRDLLQSREANEARLKTPSEMGGRDLDSGSLGGTLVRNLLYAIYQTASEYGNPEPALNWLLGRYPGTAFDDRRRSMLDILRFLAETPGASMTHWKKDQQAARIFRTRLDNWGR